MSNEPTENIAVLYEDDACAVLYKPAGLQVHPDGRNEGPFLTDWIMDRYPQTADVGEKARAADGSDLPRPGIVHRLDKDTSGAIVIAKTAAAHAVLKGQFQAREVSKAYLAFVWGEMKDEFGTISRPIGRNKNDFRKWSAAGRGLKGELRQAETYWTRLWYGRDPEGNDGSEGVFSLVKVEPRTGRTHQIRVHFLAVHHPVVGDKLYAPKKPYALGFGRLALHSWKLGFKSPGTGAPIEVVADLPMDFARAVARLGIAIT